MPLLICPNDQSPMTEIERHGVHVDMCPQCRGVWLDRGELEKLLELTSSRSNRSPQTEAARPQGRDYDRSHDRDYKPRKKKRDLFDFFDF